MALLTYNLSLDQNADSASYSWTLFASDDVTPTPLTTAHARMMIRASITDVAPIISLTDTVSAQGQIVLGGSAGTVGLVLTKVATAMLVGLPGAFSSRYIYDLFIDFADGTSTAMLSGAVFVRLAITHS